MEMEERVIELEQNVEALQESMDELKERVRVLEHILYATTLKESIIGSVLWALDLEKLKIAKYDVPAMLENERPEMPGWPPASVS
jgi:predicted nuclease with TOPRIM domain